MTFDFKCPECGVLTEAEDEWDGLETDCPACGKEILIQRIEYSNFFCPQCNKPMEGNDVICVSCGFNIQTGKKLTFEVEAESQKKQCPKCQHELNPESKICVYCGLNMQNEEKLETNIEDSNDNEKCWYCGQKANDIQYAEKFEMHRPLGSQSLGVGIQEFKYENTTFFVPRCFKCKGFQETEMKLSGCFAGIALFPAIILGFYVFIILSEYDNIVLAILGVIGLLGCPAIILITASLLASFYLRKTYKYKPINDAGYNHPSIKALHDDGWKNGHKGNPTNNGLC